jgi:imidazolonepropionase
MPIYHAITNASELLTGTGIRHKEGRKIEEVDLGRIADGAMIYSVKKSGKAFLPDRIVWVGPTKELPKKYKISKKRSLGGKRALIPGLVDSHTHLVFAGDRAEEFALRCAGASYQEIAQKGGGIQTTVRATRAASAQELERLAVERVKEAYRWGTRAIEIKSGYGLDLATEVKILEVIKTLQKRFPEMKIVSTFLGAHDFPKDISREDYLKCILSEMLPLVAKKKLAQYCDVFIDEGYFTREEGRKILEKARELGLGLRVHADELKNTESASLSASLIAHSADHLLQISPESIRSLADSETVATLLPGTAYYLKAQHAPARKLLDAGACVALATDFNPGTCMTLSLPAIMNLAALYLGMTRAEIFAAVTFNGAKALGLEDRIGTLEPGRDASFTVCPFAKFEDLYYRFAWIPE